MRATARKTWSCGRRAGFIGRVLSNPAQQPIRSRPSTPDGRRGRITPVEAKEILYQAVPYVGIAKVLDFIHATNEVLRARGVELPLEGQSTTTPETRYERGLALQKEIFGDRIDRMYEASPTGQRHIQELLSANCFGDYWTRRGLDTKTRELLT
jgi:4-carboxymuconolactone decarboxylase